MSATARRAVLCVPLAILFAVVQRATVSARAANPIKAVSAWRSPGRYVEAGEAA
jgi:hypothetical protein